MSEREAVSADRVALTVRCTAATLAGLATIVVTRNGAIISPDSTRYLAGAEGLIGGNGLVTPTGDPLVVFPPGTSIVYSVGEILPISTLRWVRLVNALCAALAVWMTSGLIARQARHVAVTILATVFAAVSVGLLFVTRAAWSEPIFVVAVLGFVTIISRLVDDAEATRRKLFVAATVVWAACMVRYAGLVLAPIGVALIAASSRRLRPALEFVAMALSVPLGWLGINLLRSGSAFGERAPSIETLSAATRDGAEVIGSWFVPIEVAAGLDTVRLVVGIAVTLVVSAAAARAVHQLWRQDAEPRSLDGLVAVAALTSLGSMVVVLVGQMRTALDAVDLRLLSPAFLPTVVVLALIVDGMVKPQMMVSFAARAAGGALVVALVGSQVVAAARFVRDNEPEQWTYTHPIWTTSHVADAVRALPADATIWTNDPFAVWALTDRRDIVEAPRSGAYRSDQQLAFPDDLPTVCGPTYVAWFARAGNYHHIPERIGQVIPLGEMVELADGWMWRAIEVPDCR